MWYMKNKLLLNILICLFFSSFFYFNKTNAIENSYTAPLLILNNPSLMLFQNGFPIGLQIKNVSLDTVNVSTVDFSAGFIYPFENKAISLGCLFNHANTYVLSTGFAQKVFISSVGAALKVESFNSKVYPNFDISYSLFINKKLWLNSNIKNIITEYSSKTQFPEINVSMNGDLNNFKFILEYVGIFYEYYRHKPLNGLSMGISYEIFKNDLLYTSIQNDIYQNKEKEIITALNISFGIKFKAGTFLNGLLTGYQHNIKSSKGSIVNNLLINPICFKDNTSPICVLTYKCEQNVDNKLIFNIKCIENEGFIKKWSLIITDYDNKEKIIKSFSGGNIPPEIIYWDYKDSFENVINKNILTAQIIVSDDSNNYSSSPIIKISFCEN